MSVYRYQINECTDIEALRKLCLVQRKQLTYVGEVLVDESKWHCTAKDAIEQIRDYLVKHQYDLDVDLGVY